MNYHKYKFRFLDYVFKILTIFLISFIFSLQARSQSLTVNQAYTDSSVFQYVAREMLRGSTPYLDTFDHKGPLLYVINALAMLISEENGLWIVELVTLFFTFLIIHSISCLFCSKKMSYLVLLSIIAMLYTYFSGGNLVEEYAMLFIAGALFIFSDYFLNNTINCLRLFLCGACLGCVLLLRPNMIALWIVMCIGVLIQCCMLHEYKKIPYFLSYFLFGVVVSIAPFIIWLACKGALRACWDSYILFNILYSTHPQRASIYAKFNSFLHFLNSAENLIALFILLIVCLKKKDLLNKLYLLLFVISFFMLSVSGQNYGHYGMILIPVLVIPFAYIGNMFEIYWNKNNMIGILVLFYISVQLVFPAWFEIMENCIYTFQNRGLNTISSQMQMISTCIQDNTSPDDRILVCGNSDVIYNLSDRFSSSYFSYQAPVCSLSAPMNENFIKELSTSHPVMIVLPDSFYAYRSVMQFIEEHSYEKLQLDGLQGYLLFKQTL